MYVFMWTVKFVIALGFNFIYFILLLFFNQMFCGIWSEYTSQLSAEKDSGTYLYTWHSYQVYIICTLFFFVFVLLKSKTLICVLLSVRIATMSDKRSFSSTLLICRGLTLCFLKVYLLVLHEILWGEIASVLWVLHLVFLLFILGEEQR